MHQKRTMWKVWYYVGRSIDWRSLESRSVGADFGSISTFDRFCTIGSIIQNNICHFPEYNMLVRIPIDPMVPNGT